MAASKERAAAAEATAAKATRDAASAERTARETRDAADDAEARARAAEASLATTDLARREAERTVASLADELRVARDDAGAAELRAADAEAATEAMKAELEAELERETERARYANARPDAAVAKERERLGTLVADANERAARAEAEAERLAAALENAERRETNDSISTSRDRSNTVDGALEAQLEEALARAEVAERAAEAARLLSRPGLDSETLERLRAAAEREETTEKAREAAENRAAAAEEASEKARKEASAAKAAAEEAEAAFERRRERALALVRLKDDELDALRRRLRGGADERASSAERGSDQGADQGADRVDAEGAASGTPDENLEHLKSVVLKFLEAPDWDTQQQMIPVLGTLLRWDPSDFRRVHRAREAWEPADVTIAKHLPELGGYGNSITSSLGLGNIF